MIFDNEVFHEISPIKVEMLLLFPSRCRSIPIKVIFIDSFITVALKSLRIIFIRARTIDIWRLFENIAYYLKRKRTQEFFPKQRKKKSIRVLLTCMCVCVCTSCYSNVN